METRNQLFMFYVNVRVHFKLFLYELGIIQYVKFPINNTDELI